MDQLTVLEKFQPLAIRRNNRYKPISSNDLKEMIVKFFHGFLCIAMSLGLSSASSAQVGSEVDAEMQSAAVSAKKPAKPAKERASRIELKQSVSKMTYAAGDRRIIKLNGEKTSPSKKAKPNRLQNKTKHGRTNPSQERLPFTIMSQPSDPVISVQCNPLGEAEAIGDLEPKPENYVPKFQGGKLDIIEPPSVSLSTENWRRIAELACLEEEI